MVRNKIKRWDGKDKQVAVLQTNFWSKKRNSFYKDKGKHPELDTKKKQNKQTKNLLTTCNRQRKKQIKKAKKQEENTSNTNQTNKKSIFKVNSFYFRMKAP